MRRFAVRVSFAGSFCPGNRAPLVRKGCYLYSRSPPCHFAANTTQKRLLSWNPLKWGRQDIGRSSLPTLEEGLPDIFSQLPEEVSDYVQPEKSVFEKLEDVWDWLLSFMQPIEKQMEIMRSLRKNGFLGMDFLTWGHVLLFYGICLRLITIIPSLYSHRNSLRMGRISSQMSELTNSQNKAKNDKTLSTAEKRVLKEGYNRMKYALYKREKCAQWKSFGGLVTAPLTGSAFLAIRRLTLYEADLNNSSFLWTSDLTVPDPTFALPLICGGMFLVNFELNQRMQRGGRSSGSLYVRWGTRIGTLVGVYFFSSQPAALFAYWIGLSCAGVLQPLLLRWQPFRQLFDFPDPPMAAITNIIGSVGDSKKGWFFKRLFTSRGQLADTSIDLDERAPVSHFEKIDEYDVVFETKKSPPHK